MYLLSCPFVLPLKLIVATVAPEQQQKLPGLRLETNTWICTSQNKEHVLHIKRPSQKKMVTTIA